MSILELHVDSLSGIASQNSNISFFYISLVIFAQKTSLEKKAAM